MTKIEWTQNPDGTPGKTWNPIVGCSIVSPGCTNCYAMRMAARINKMTLCSHYEGLTQSVNGKPVWTGKVALAPDHIFNAPLKWRKSTRVFVNSMGDLFHEDVPDEWIDRVFAVMLQSSQHTFQVLTKRAKRMREYCHRLYDLMPVNKLTSPFPKNCWLGVSTEDQARADERMPLLLETPAVVRFISAEPLLAPIDLRSGGYPDWVIVGGESGPGKRPVNLDWMRSIRDQCAAAGVPLFVKQIDKKIPIPEDLMIREFPL